MLAYHRVVLFHFQFIRGCALVLVSRVVVTGAGRRYHLDFVSHRSLLLVYSLNGFAAGANIAQHLLYAFLVNYTHALGRHPQIDETLLRLNPEPVIVQIGKKPSTSAVLSV